MQRKREDNFYETLNLSSDLYNHQNCYLAYTSTNHIDRYLKRKKQNKEGSSSSVKCSKQSSTAPSDFKKNCLICGEACNVEEDKNIQKDGVKTKASCVELPIAERESDPLKTYYYR